MHILVDRCRFLKGGLPSGRFSVVCDVVLMLD